MRHCAEVATGNEQCIRTESNQNIKCWYNKKNENKSPICFVCCVWVVCLCCVRYVFLQSPESVCVVCASAVCGVCVLRERDANNKSCRQRNRTHLGHDGGWARRSWAALCVEQIFLASLKGCSVLAVTRRSTGSSLHSEVRGRL